MNRIIAAFFVFISSVSVAEEILVSDSEYVISKDTVAEFTEISIEFINDYENHLNGKFPDIDFASILIDKNNNSKMDAKIDIYYSESNGNICSGMLISSKASLPCGSYVTNGKIFHYFMKTKLNPMPHPIIKFLIPSKEIRGANGMVSVVFKIHSSGKGYKSYPSADAAESFSNVIDIKI